MRAWPDCGTPLETPSRHSQAGLRRTPLPRGIRSVRDVQLARRGVAPECSQRGSRSPPARPQRLAIARPPAAQDRPAFIGSPPDGPRWRSGAGRRAVAIAGAGSPGQSSARLPRGDRPGGRGAIDRWSVWGHDLGGCAVEDDRPGGGDDPIAVERCPVTSWVTATIVTADCRLTSRAGRESRPGGGSRGRWSVHRARGPGALGQGGGDVDRCRQPSVSSAVDQVDRSPHHPADGLAVLMSDGRGGFK